MERNGKDSSGKSMEEGQQLGILLEKKGKPLRMP
jgi:hypothetical protein